MNEKKVHQMIRVARYEQKAESEDLKIHKYYRRDYVAFAMIRNFFVVTIGYGLLLGAVLLYNMEFLLNNLKNLNVKPLLITIGTGYVFVLALYSVLVYTLCSLRYLRAERKAKRYYSELKKLRNLQRMEKNTLKQQDEIQEVQ
ncbi:MAG: hypothetical protein Q4B85_05190 [Lachnospiraceae bacterium]|nr:hypothetical protein [Lachnospiraceae bacterium]